MTGTKDTILEASKTENKPEISKYVFRYIVPFGFDENGDLDSYKEIVRNLKKSNNWQKDDWDEFHNLIIPQRGNENKDEKNEYGGSDIYSYLKELYMADGNSSIGSMWEYTNTSNLPVYKYFWEENIEKIFPEVNIFIHITKAGLYLLKTGIGLFWYEIKFTNKENEEYIPSIRELKYFQNRFKELAKKDKSDAKRYLCLVDGEQEVKCRVGEWIAHMLSTEVSNKIFYYPGRQVQKNEEKKILPDKAILYNYLVANQAEYLERTAYYLTMGYSENYRCKQEMMDDIKYPFENELWYASKEGCGCYVYSERYNYVFQQYLPIRMKSDYFLMFMHLLQQSYTIMQMNTYIAKNVSAEEENSSEVLEKIAEKINRFMIKNVNASVSHIGHHNEYYCYVEQSLKIQEDMEALNQGVEALGDILRRQESVARDKIQERMQRAFALLTIIGIVEMQEKICRFLKIDCVPEAPIANFRETIAVMSTEEKGVYIFIVFVLLLVILSSANLLWQWFLEVVGIIIKLPVNVIFLILELPAQIYLGIKKMISNIGKFLKKKIIHIREVYNRLK